MDTGLVTGMAAISVSVHTLRVLAQRGLVSPSDVEGIAEDITAHLRVGEDHPQKAAYDQLSAVFEAQLSPSLAGLREIARANWKG